MFLSQVPLTPKAQLLDADGDDEGGSDEVVAAAAAAAAAAGAGASAHDGVPDVATAMDTEA